MLYSKFILRSLALFMMALPLMACGEAKNFSHLHCEWMDGEQLKTADYCYDKSGTVCGNYWPVDAEYCAWLVFASTEHNDIQKFTPSEDGVAYHEWTTVSCNAESPEIEVEHYPPNPAQPNNTCNDDNNGVEVAANAGPYPATIDQVVGSLRSVQGPLTLNFNYELPMYGTVSLSLHTL